VTAAEGAVREGGNTGSDGKNEEVDNCNPCQGRRGCPHFVVIEEGAVIIRPLCA